MRSRDALECQSRGFIVFITPVLPRPFSQEKGKPLLRMHDGRLVALAVWVLFVL